ncbi:MAG: hypothetical protein N2489_11295 [Clostridia bacterium]|nr:hypothetical protein [Clostridia bacterium]
MKFSKQFWILILMIAMTALSGCNELKEGKRKIYYDNSRIAQQGDSYFFFKHSENTIGEKTSRKFDEFIGVKTLWHIETKEEAELEFELDCKADKGKLKMVVVAEDGEVIDIFEQEFKGNKKVKIPRGKNTVKMVGLDAAGHINAVVKQQEGIKIRSGGD